MADARMPEKFYELARTDVACGNRRPARKEAGHRLSIIAC